MGLDQRLLKEALIKSIRIRRRKTVQNFFEVSSTPRVLPQSQAPSQRTPRVLPQSQAPSQRNSRSIAAIFGEVMDSFNQHKIIGLNQRFLNDPDEVHIKNDLKNVELSTIVTERFQLLFDEITRTVSCNANFMN